MAAMGQSPTYSGGKRAARDQSPPVYFADPTGGRNRNSKARRAESRMQGGSPLAMGGGPSFNGIGGGANGGQRNQYGGAGSNRAPHQRAGGGGPAPHVRPGGQQVPRQAPPQQAHQPQRQGQPQQPQQRQGPAGPTQPRFPKSAFPLTPGSLTTVFSRNGVPTGAVDAMEAQAGPGQVFCAFRELRQGGCNKPACTRCLSGHRATPQQVAAVKAAMAPGLSV